MFGDQLVLTEDGCSKRSRHIDATWQRLLKIYVGKCRCRTPARGTETHHIHAEMARFLWK
eukprot:1975227-Amphidinium_carterae.1